MCYYCRQRKELMGLVKEPEDWETHIIIPQLKDNNEEKGKRWTRPVRDAEYLQKE